jgi:hypothetical protein
MHPIYTSMLTKFYFYKKRVLQCRIVHHLIYNVDSHACGSLHPLCSYISMMMNEVEHPFQASYPVYIMQLTM